MSGRELRSKLAGRVHDGIDLARDGGLHAGERRDDIAERHSTDDQKIHVARSSKSSARGGSVDGRERDSIRQRAEGPSDLVGEPGGLDEDALQLLEYRRSRVRLVKDLVPPDGAREDSRNRELFELLRYGPRRRAAHPDQLPDVEGLVGVREKPPEELAPGLPEQHRGRVGRGGAYCTHISYDCTRNAYELGEAGRADPDDPATAGSPE